MNNIPQGEVLAANFRPGGYGYKEKIIGSLRVETKAYRQVLICEDEHQQLENCTHFIYINKFDIEPQKVELLHGRMVHSKSI